MEGKEGIEKQQTGNFAKIVSHLMKRLNVLKKFGTSFVFINQLRENLSMAMLNGGNGGKNTTGGLSIKYFCDVRIKLDKYCFIQENIVGSDKPINTGAFLKVTAEKNRGAKGNIPYILPVIFGKGVSNILTIKEALKHKKILNSDGNVVNMLEEGVSGWNVLTLGSEEDQTFKVQGQQKLHKLLAEKYQYIMDNKLIVQEDFQIKMEDGTNYGE